MKTPSPKKAKKKKKKLTLAHARQLARVKKWIDFWDSVPTFCLLEKITL